MSDYKGESTYRTPVRLMKGSYVNQNGFKKKVYTETIIDFLVSCKSYGGSEKLVNNMLVIEDTYILETWYRNDVKSEDAIKFLESDLIYEIINNPEDINMAHKRLLFKVRRYTGGV